jgi:hypothetical protein
MDILKEEKARSDIRFRSLNEPTRAVCVAHDDDDDDDGNYNEGD